MGKRLRFAQCNGVCETEKTRVSFYATSRGEKIAAASMLLFIFMFFNLFHSRYFGFECVICLLFILIKQLMEYSIFFS